MVRWSRWEEQRNYQPLHCTDFIFRTQNTFNTIIYYYVDVRYDVCINCNLRQSLDAGISHDKHKNVINREKGLGGGKRSITRTLRGRNEDVIYCLECSGFLNRSTLRHCSNYEIFWQLQTDTDHTKNIIFLFFIILFCNFFNCAEPDLRK